MGKKKKRTILQLRDSIALILNFTEYYNNSSFL